MLQPTPNQLSIDGLEQNILLNAINSPQKVEFTWDVSNGYNLIELLMYLRPRNSRAVNGMGGAIQKPIMGTNRVIAEVATRTVTLGNLVLTFTDASYNLFRLKQAVIDGTPASNTGRVIAAGPGTVTLEPDAAITAAGGWAAVTTSFPVGGFALAAYDNSGFYDSHAPQPLFQTPFMVTDLVAAMRQSLPLRLADFFATYTKYNGGFWANGQEMLTYKDLKNQIIRRDYFSKFGTTQSNLEGVVNWPMGFRQAIMDSNRGGFYTNYTNPLAQADWDNWLTSVADLQAISTGGNATLNICVGRYFLERVQSFTAPYIQFGGSMNTFGGSSVKGLDVRTYSYGGITANLFLDPVLNDIASYPTGSTIPGITGTIRQNTAFALDLNDYEPAGGGGMLPSLESLYWQELGQETIFAYEPGLIGNRAGSTSGVFSLANVLATNDSPSAQLHILDMSSKSLIASRCGWIEPAS